jgi:hypothetical protein
MVKSLQDVPSPCFTPIFDKNSYKVLLALSTTIPVDFTYMFYMICMSYGGKCSTITKAYQSFCLSILSYALCRSMNARLSFRLARRLCWMIVCKINACSVVPWWARKPACVGAWRSRRSAAAVKRWFMVAIKSLVKGGVIAMDL